MVFSPETHKQEVAFYFPHPQSHRSCYYGSPANVILLSSTFCWTKLVFCPHPQSHLISDRMIKKKNNTALCSNIYISCRICCGNVESGDET